MARKDAYRPVLLPKEALVWTSWLPQGCLRRLPATLTISPGEQPWANWATGCVCAELLFCGAEHAERTEAVAKTITKETILRMDTISDEQRVWLLSRDRDGDALFLK